MEKVDSEFIVIKKLRFTDISKVLKMYNESSEELKKNFLNPWVLTSRLGLVHLYLSVSPFRRVLLLQISSLVAKEVDEVVGFVYINERKYKKKDRKDLGIIVKEGYQGRGIGNKLMSEIFKKQDDVWLSVLESNKKAIKLYEKHGFKTEYVFRIMKLKKESDGN